MAFTAKDVMSLRELTGAGMMDCKKALTECEGDMEKAKDFLREKGLAAAAKKAGRIAAEGIVGSFVTADYGVLVEVNCETDFVAKTDNFKALVDAVALQVGKAKPATVEELLEQDFVEEPGKKFSMLINEAVAKIGEKISIRRFERYEGAVDSYIHMGGKIGVLVETDVAPATDAAREAVHSVALQIAAAKPLYVHKDEVPHPRLRTRRKFSLRRPRMRKSPSPTPSSSAWSTAASKSTSRKCACWSSRTSRIPTSPLPRCWAPAAKSSTSCGLPATRWARGCKSARITLPKKSWGR